MSERTDELMSAAMKAIGSARQMAELAAQQVKAALGSHEESSSSQTTAPKQAKPAATAAKSAPAAKKTAAKQPEGKKATEAKPEAKKSAAKPAAKKPAAKKSAAAPKKAAGTSPTQTEIREWAKANGYDVKPQGRIAKAVVDAYNADH